MKTGEGRGKGAGGAALLPEDLYRGWIDQILGCNCAYTCKLARVHNMRVCDVRLLAFFHVTSIRQLIVCIGRSIDGSAEDRDTRVEGKRRTRGKRGGGEGRGKRKGWWREGAGFGPGPGLYPAPPLFVAATVLYFSPFFFFFFFFLILLLLLFLLLFLFVPSNRCRFLFFFFSFIPRHPRRRVTVSTTR